jgi:hypothetical protein
LALNLNFVSFGAFHLSVFLAYFTLFLFGFSALSGVGVGLWRIALAVLFGLIFLKDKFNMFNVLAMLFTAGGVAVVCRWCGVG